MILSKASLCVVELTKTDKDIPLLDAVHITSAGTVVASNGKGVIAVSPLPEEVSNVVPVAGIALPSGVDTGIADGRGITLSSDFVKELIRSMPADKLFKGLLEFCRIGRIAKSIHGMVTDGKREKTLTGRSIGGEYVPYESIFKRFFACRTGNKVILDVKRLKVMLDVVCKVCPDSGGVLPVYLEFTDAGGIILRAVNVATGQRVVSVLSSADGQWLDPDTWEKKLTGTIIGKKRKVFQHDDTKGLQKG